QKFKQLKNCTRLNAQRVIKYSISLRASNPLSDWHYINLICADLVSIIVISTNVPYMNPPIARPMHN
ncbi:MAG: hypothetical protein QM530_07545, partial [Phycisphaerales bacterium]|nr:hypothetical protein [Phycisphaerales bacterium]